jgi:NhaA family Na+:H+ antiporter
VIEALGRLEPPCDPRRDHALGREQAEITLLEFGSYTCPYCHEAHEVVRNLRDRFGDRLRYAFRHRPLSDEISRRAAVLAEYAGETRGVYWEAHQALMTRGPRLADADLDAVAAELELPPRQAQPAAWERAEERVAADVASARASGARVTPTFFINGRRYEGAWDESALAEALYGRLAHRVQLAALDFARWAPSTGVLLLLATLAAVVLANSRLGPAIEALWALPVGVAAGERGLVMPLRGFVNDGLLTVFFLVVGLEIKREFTIGRLASRKAAALPFAAAAGGMLAPSLIYLAIAPASLSAGWAVPTTTDTAFAVALIALLGTRVPVELRILLTATVVIDDLAAIVIVGVFYSGALDVGFLGGAAAVAAAMAVLNRIGVYRALPYALLGVALWVCLHAGGLHATLAGVVLALATPTRPPANLLALLAQAEAVVRLEMREARDDALRHGPSETTLRAFDAVHDRIESPAAKLLRTVEPWSSYLVLPVFALANAGLVWSPELLAGHERLMLAIVLGLVIGKPTGMVAGAALAVRLGVATKAESYSWRQLAGATALAGIGFTMSLYIAAKAFPVPGDFAAAKLAVFIASGSAGAIGTAWLAAAARRLSEAAGSTA